ncbi:T9SS type A sorting domain-containing protein [candidate division KSB1 bacterium]|nr:T9SS type A sorting domain-containing protein [candidate division KSB1 bacterium]
MYYTTNGTAAFDSVSMVYSGNAGVYQANIPGPDADATIYYYVQASNVGGKTGYCPRGAPMALYSFNVGSDRIPPIVAHTPLSHQSFFTSAFHFEAEITDNSGIEYAQLIISQNKGLPDTVVMTPATENVYQAEVKPNSLNSGDLFEYYIEAADASVNHNKTRLPETGFYRFVVLGSILYDFEDNSGSFSATGDWDWGIPLVGPSSSHSGVKVWGTRLNSNYSNSSNSKLIIPQIDLAGIANCQVTFWHWYSVEYGDGELWDGGNVKLSVDGEAYQVVTPVGGYDKTINPYNEITGGEPGFGGPANSGNFWHQERIDLSAYKDRTVSLEFHFGSDDNTTAPGWYIDDVEVLLLQNNPPMITQTTRLPNTSDISGPYVVYAEIFDDFAIEDVSLYYSLNDDGSFTALQMTKTSGDSFQGQIPGQAYGTSVRYYVGARDIFAEEITDPINAPVNAYQFLVTNRVPQLVVELENTAISIQEGSTYVDSLLLRNLGLIDLTFQFEDSAVGEVNAALSWNDSHSKIPSSLPEFNSENNLKGKYLSRRIDAGIELDHYSYVLNNERLESTEQAEPGITGCYADVRDLVIYFKLEFDAPLDETNATLRMAIDTDQNKFTGKAGFELAAKGNSGCIGAEYDLIFDLANRLKSGRNVILFDNTTASVTGAIPVTIKENRLFASVPLSMLGNDDGNMNALLWMQDENNAINQCIAPEAGYWVIGTEQGLPWITFEPVSGVIPGEDSVFVKMTIAPPARGEYNLVLKIRTNSPDVPVTELPLHISVLTTAIEQPARTASEIPAAYELSQNYPNPFNSATRIKYDLPQSGWVSLKIYSLLGQEVRTLFEGQKSAGTFWEHWDGRDQFGNICPSGIYVVKIVAAGFESARKMILLQ